MSWISNLFSGKSIIETATKAADSMVYTSEESETDKIKKQELFIELTKAASPSAISRRVVAWVVAGNATFYSAAAFIAALCGKEEMAKFAGELLVDVWAIPLIAVIGFYFGTSMLGARK